MTAKFYGKHRGVVIDNRDPLQRGRLRVQVPDVPGSPTSAWAEPCAPLAGPTGSSMGVYMIPPIGTRVWVEFERGDPDFPIWVGCLWGSAADVPPAALTGPSPEQVIVVQTVGGNSVEIRDAPSGIASGIVLKSASGAMILVSDTGISIENGKGASIRLVGPTVDVNAGALTVT